MKRTTTFLPILLLFSLAACTLPVAQPPITPTVTGPTILRVATLRQAPIGQITDAMVAAFQARHPDVQVEIEPLPNNYPTSLFADAKAARLPDVIFTADVFVTSFAAEGVLLNVEEYARGDRSVRLDDIYENFLALGQANDLPGLYMLPVSLDTVQMYYNRTLWEASGAPLPSDDWRWDDLIAACKQIQQANPQVTCLSFASEDLFGFDWWVHWLPWVRGAGGDVLSPDGAQSMLDDEATLEGLTAYTELWTKHGIAALPNQDNPACFVRQTCAVTFFFPGAVQTLRDQIGQRFAWDVQLTPSHPRGRFSSMGTYGFGVGRSTRYPDLAWELVRFLSTVDGQKQLASAGLGVPVLKSLANEPLDGPPANMRIFVAAASTGIATPIYPIACGTLYGGPVQEAIGGALLKVVRGDETPEAAFAAADRAIQTCLDQQR